MYKKHIEFQVHCNTSMFVEVCGEIGEACTRETENHQANRTLGLQFM